MIVFVTRHSIVRHALPFLLVFLASVSAAFAQAVSPLPPPTGYVNDFAGVIEPETKRRMEAILTALKQKADIEFAVVTVKTTGGQDIFDYSLAVARGWGIGSKGGDKNGLLLLVAVDDRKYFTQVSDHLEGDLPDGLVGEIGRRMRDPFRRGDYSAGLMAAVQTIVSTLQEKRGFKLDEVDPALAYHEPERVSRPQTSRSRLSPCALVFIVIIVIIFLLASRGRGGGGGCLNMLFLGSMLSSGRSGGGFSSGWSSGGFGGSSGGGGGGFGGFGGGGSFGGGGAGGSW